MKKMYCLVVKDDYSRFSWVFFLATKDETSEIHKIFITSIENLIDLKVKVIRCDNGTEFKNKVMNQFCEIKGIKREFSVARTPQQNGVAERKNRTLIEAARTMLADSKLSTTFWAEAVNTACYVENRVLVIKPHNKTPYERFLGRKSALSFIRPFGCPITILNTLDHLGNFDGKADEGFFVEYSTNRNGPNWLFDIDALTISMNYKPVIVGNQTNGNTSTKENIAAGQAGKKIVPAQEYILLPLLTSDPSLSKSSKDSPDARFKPSGEEEKMDSEHLKNKDSKVPNIEDPRVHQEQDANVNNTNNINTICPTINVADIENNVVDENIVYGCIDDPSMPNLEEIVYSDNDEEVGAEADMNNLAIIVPISSIPTTRVHKDHLLEQIIGDIHSAPQKRRMTKNVIEHVEPKKVIQDLTDPSWIEVYRNKKDDRGIVVRNTARLMDVKSAFLYGTIEEEVYVCQPPRFEDPEFPNKVYKVEKALYGLHQAPRAWYETLSTYLLENRFRRGTIDKTLFIKKDKDDILLVQVQDKYLVDILKKFDFATIKIDSTPMESNKALLKDEEAADVDVHLYRSMIGSLMYLTASRLDILFIVCSCGKGLWLSLWYPRDSPFNLEAFFDSDYASASLDRKSTTGVCQFLGRRLISCQCKKQTTVANSTTEAEIGINKWYQSFALRNFVLEDMEFESTNSNTIAKLPIIKLENSISWVSVPQTSQENGTSVMKMSVPATAEEKTNKKNDVKARSLLFMALSNDHQLTFSQYPDAKTIFAAIETRFGCNEATKKTHKTLLKQQYENFSASSAESLDSIFNRLQKIVSRLAILGVVIAQEELNSKFLSSLPPEWNTYVVVWMNKPKIKTMSIDDLYNNFKIVEQKVKKSVGASSGAQNLTFMTAPSTSSTNHVNTDMPAYEVSTASSDVNTASPQVSTASFSDNVVYAFMVESPNGSNLIQQDLEQIHEDDLEAMDLKWRLSLLMCFNYHKMGHFARECRAPRREEVQFKNQDNTRKQGNNEDTSSKARLAIDGVGFDKE
ncbi:putative ribonuclease H-like domain-containing protein [Tanacetum coccineum]